LSVVPSEPASGASTTTTSFALGIAAVDLASLQGQNRGFDVPEAFGARLDENAGDFTTGRRDDAVWIEQTSRDEGTAAD
jgi:hypothetical protein